MHGIEEKVVYLHQIDCTSAFEVRLHGLESAFLWYKDHK